MLALVILIVAVAGAFSWTTRWQYLESRGRLIRVNRWTGTTKVFKCGLTQEGTQTVRTLQVELANVMLSRPGLTALLAGAEILPCPTCAVDGKKAEEIAERFRKESKPPWGTDPRVLGLLERLETTRATHWQCAYR